MDTILINGVKYYKLPETMAYQGDEVKNCALKAIEVDENFNTLRGHDIAAVAIDNNHLILRRLNGGEMSVELNESTTITTDNLKFNYDSSNGNLTITYPNDEQLVISGFTTTLYTDSTLKGNGSINSPLGVKNTEKTGSYSPASEYIELNSGEELPTSGMTPGYRVVTKEISDIFGKLYSVDGLDIISEYLTDENSDWRIPSKHDWDTLLDSLETEHTEPGYLPHSSETIGFLGEIAAQPLKSDYLWAYNDNPINEDGTCGFDVYGFDIIPVGNDYNGDKTPTGFGSASTIWTSTLTEDGYYVKMFVYDTNKVGQDITDVGFYAIRLVKDYDGANYKGVESIFGQDYPTILIPETNQIWTTINVYATKKQITELSNGVNFIDVNDSGASFDNFKVSFYINEWNGNEWIKKELAEGDSIVIKDTDADIEEYYRKWIVKNGELRSFEDYATSRINKLIDDLDEFINERLEPIIKETIKSYLEETVNEIKITETEQGKLKIGFSDDAIFG